MSKIIKYDVSIYSDSSLSTFVQHYGLEDQEGIENPIDVQLSNLSIGKKYWASATVRDDAPSDSPLSNTFHFATLPGVTLPSLYGDYECLYAVENVTTNDVGISETGIQISDASTFETYEEVKTKPGQINRIMQPYGTRYARAYVIDEYKRRYVDASVSSATVPKGVAEPDISKYFRIKNISSSVATVTVDQDTVIGGSDSNMEFRKEDDPTWTRIRYGETVRISIVPGGTCMFRNSDYEDGNSVRYHFSCDRLCSFGGDIRSIIDYHNIEDKDIITDGLFESAFRNGLWADTPDFSWVVEIGENGLAHSFEGCGSLSSASGFTSLEYVGRNALSYAFSGCVSLKTGPQFGSKRIGVNGEAGETYFGGMFYGDENVRCIYAPNIPVEWNDDMYADWVEGVAENGVIDFCNEVQPTTITEGTSGIPENWTKMLNGKEY